MSDPITLSGTIPDLLCPGMLATGRFDAGSWVTGRIVAVDAPGERAKYPHHPRCSVGIADNYGMRPFQPEEVDIDLSDSLTLQATVAWCATRVVGRTVEPHECMAVLLPMRLVVYRCAPTPILCIDTNEAQWDPITHEVTTSRSHSTHGLGRTIRAAVLAIHEGRIQVGPNV